MVEEKENTPPLKFFLKIKPHLKKVGKKLLK
jgi:hypothetical protein